MNNKKRSMIAINRNLFVALAVLVGLAASGMVAWQVGATGGSTRDVNRTGVAQIDLNPAAERPEAGNPSSPSVKQVENQAIYRGVRTAARFDISPPLRSMSGAASIVEPEVERSDFE